MMDVLSIVVSSVALLLAVILFILNHGIRIVIAEIATRQREILSRERDLIDSMEKFKSFLRFETDLDAPENIPNPMRTRSLGALRSNNYDYQGSQESES